MDTSGEARTNSLVTFFNEPRHMDVQVLVDQQEHFYISSVRTQDAIWKTCRERRIIGTEEEEEEKEEERERERERERARECQGNLCR